MKDLKAIKGRYYIARLIEEGEHEHQDFKFAISDARKIARSVSAFANNDGGRLLVGVKDNGAIAGIRNEEDIFVVEQAASMYCVPSVPLEFTAFATGEGHVVLRVDIKAAERRPVMVVEADGRHRAYYRVHDENIAAHPLMVQAWRLAAAPDDERRPLVVSSSSPEGIILGLIADGPARLDRLAIDAHLSRSLTDAAVVNLIAAGLARFVYIDGAFRLVAI